MTTVDIYLHKIGTREFIGLHSGLYGPATSLFHAVLAACQDGTAQGVWSASHADVKLPGALLRQMLTELDDLDQLWAGSTEAEVLAYRDAVTDDAIYEINAVAA